MRREMARLISCATVAAIVAALASTSAGASGPGLIVFSASESGKFVQQLFAVQPSGDGLTQLTTGGANALAPAFSPSGARIAYVRSGYGIYTMNPDGTHLRRLTTNGRDSYPAWSPDGKSIAFVRPFKTKWRVWIVPATGGKQRVLAQTPPAGRPSWTSKGLLIPTGGDLLRVDTKNGRVLKYYGANIDAIWGLNSVTVAPDVSLLTYVGSRQPIPGDTECGEGPCQRFGLYLESLTAKHKVPKLIVKDTGAAGFSPDGKQLVFSAGGGLVLRSLATGELTSIATPNLTPAPGAPPTWR
jgi:TolB protein